MSNIRKTLWILSLGLIFSCQKSEYKTVDLHEFEITIPSSWENQKIQGLDSYVGGIITDKNDTLIFDLGWYSQNLTRNVELLIYDNLEYSKLTEEQKDRLKGIKHLVISDFETANYNPRDYVMNEFQKDSIDCFEVTFVMTKYPEFGTSGVYIDSLKGSQSDFNKTKFSFYGKDLSIETQSEFFKALRTLNFKDYCD